MTDPDLSVDLGDYQAKDPQQALDAALAAVRSHCGWHIAPSVSTSADVWSPDGHSLFLRTLDLTAVTSVVQDGTTVSPTSYTFESYGMVRGNLGACFGRNTKVTVAFTHGYAALPLDVRDVVLALAQRSMNDTRGLVPRGSGGSTSMVVVESYGSQLSDADMAKLAPFSLPGFA